MPAKKTETSRTNTKANPNRSASTPASSPKAAPTARKTAAKSAETTQKAGTTSRSPAGGAKRARKAPGETVIPAGLETPLSTSRRRAPGTREPGAPPAPNAVTVVARVDVGFGNAVFIRGEGGGLSWDSGIPLECCDGGEWAWRGQSDHPLEFKLLRNDRDWSAGENITAGPGEKIECSPRFD